MGPYRALLGAENRGDFCGKSPCFWLFISSMYGRALMGSVVPSFFQKSPPSIGAPPWGSNYPNSDILYGNSRKLLVSLDFDFDFAPLAVMTVTSKWKRARRRKHHEANILYTGGQLQKIEVFIHAVWGWN